jgi:glycogen debranching enzyme
MSSPKVSVLDGSTFVVSDASGDIDATPTDTTGLFHSDTRHLSRWILTLDGQRLGRLTADISAYNRARFFVVPSSGTVYVNSKISVIRSRVVGDGFREEITVMNHSGAPIDIELRLQSAADFADLFEVKDALPKKGTHYARVEDDKIVLGYRRQTYVRETWIRSTQKATLSPDGLTYRVHVGAHGEWSTAIDVSAVSFADKVLAAAKPTAAKNAPRERGGSASKNVPEWLEDAPKLRSSWRRLHHVYDRCLVDLAALRFFPMLAPGSALPAAGLPWFMALFGRDSIITSLQALPYQPDLAQTTLRVLGLRQGTRRDDFRDEEPGKILHESRVGELTAFEERPQSPYFGSADATPLWLVLLDEYERWTGDVTLVRSLEQEARAALQWIDEYGDRDGDGYIEYARRNEETGLENQCWKDSWDSIAFRNGKLAPLPRATCEIQGYAYDAKVRCARLAREVWQDAALADRLERQAADLKRRFNRDYWIPEGRFFALALDGEKRKVDSLTSNIGHLLWSGIVDDDKVDDVVSHLMGDKLFSGWGVRTMAEGEGSYNPIGYHVGTVWPHDNSIIAAGLRRYRRDTQAARIALGILQAADFFDGRLPEAFAGYSRARAGCPVEYPTACSPQAWATGAPLLLLTTLLGLEPVGDRLLVNPGVPTTIETLALIGIPGRWGRADAFARGRLDLVDNVGAGA